MNSECEVITYYNDNDEARFKIVKGDQVIIDGLDHEKLNALAEVFQDKSSPSNFICDKSGSIIKCSDVSFINKSNLGIYAYAHSSRFEIEIDQLNNWKNWLNKEGC